MQITITDNTEEAWVNQKVIAKVTGSTSIPNDGDVCRVYVAFDANVWATIPTEWKDSKEFAEFISAISKAEAKMLLSLVYGIPEKGSAAYPFTLNDYAYTQDEKNGIKLLG